MQFSNQNAIGSCKQGGEGMTSNKQPKKCKTEYWRFGAALRGPISSSRIFSNIKQVQQHVK